jgi:hypothetical protein
VSLIISSNSENASVIKTKNGGRKDDVTVKHVGTECLLKIIMSIYTKSYFSELELIWGKF